GDRTQNRPDAWVIGTRSVVRYDVDVRGTRQPITEATRALWYAGADKIPNELVDLEVGSGGTGVATVTPALGPHDRKRITGCLEDAVIDRIQGDVISIVDEPARSSAVLPEAGPDPARGVEDPAHGDHNRVRPAGALGGEAHGGGELL